MPATTGGRRLPAREAGMQGFSWKGLRVWPVASPVTGQPSTQTPAPGLRLLGGSERQQPGSHECHDSDQGGNRPPLAVVTSGGMTSGMKLGNE